MNDEHESKIDTAKSQVAEAIGARPRTFPTRWTAWSRKPRPIPARPSRPKCWSGLRR